MNGMYRPGMLGAAGGTSSADSRRLIQPYPIQPAPAPGSAAALQPIAIAPAPTQYIESITPLDQSKPPHLVRIYAQQPHRQQAGGFPDLSQRMPLTPLTPLDQHVQQDQYVHQEVYHQRASVSQTEDHTGQYPQYYTHTPNSVTGSFPVSPESSDRPPPISPEETGPGAMYSSQFFPGPSSHGTQYSGAPSMSAFTASAGANPNSCPFDPPLDSKYAMASGAGQMNHPPQEYPGLFKISDNFLPRRSPPFVFHEPPSVCLQWQCYV